MAGVALIAACSSPPPSRPDNREAAYRENNRGVAELEQYAYDKAVASFRRAIALDDRVALPYLNLTIALYYASNLEDAHRAIDAAESRFSNSPKAPFMRGLIDLSDYATVTNSSLQFQSKIQFALQLPTTHPGFMPVTRDLSLRNRAMILTWYQNGAPEGVKP